MVVLPFFVAILLATTTFASSLLNRDSMECKVACENFKTIIKELTTHNSSNIYGKISLATDAGVSLNNVFHSCLNLLLLDNSLKHFEKFQDMGEVFSYLFSYARKNRKAAVKVLADLVKDFDGEKILNVLSKLPSLLLQKEGPSSRKVGQDPRRFSFINGFVLNFLMYSGSLTNTFPPKCASLLNEILSSLIEPLVQLYTFSGLQQPLEKFLVLPKLVKDLMLDCELPLQDTIKAIGRPRNWIRHVFTNLKANAEAISTNLENAELAAKAQDWARVGAWMGLMAYNIVFDMHNEQPFLDPNIIAKAFNSEI